MSINAEPDACGSPAEDPINPNPQQFAQVAVGGTFDHIHAGHKILLTMTALLASKRVACGVTGMILSLFFLRAAIVKHAPKRSR